MVHPDARERAHGRAGPVRLRWGGVVAGGAGLAWPVHDRWHARLHLWSGARELRGHWVWRAAQDDAAALALWRSGAGQPWRTRTLPGAPALRFLAQATSASQRPPCVLRVALRLSPAASRLVRRAVQPLGLARGADDLAAATHLMAWADLPFACSPSAAFVRLELAGAIAGDPPARAGADPWAHWTAWAERHAADTRAVCAALEAHGADVLIDLQDFGAAVRRAGFAGYAPRVDQPDGVRRYALVDARAAFDGMTLAHELGHLVGAGHAPAYGVTSTLDRLAAAGRPIGARGLPCASARGWHSPRRGLQTVMGGLGADASRAYETLPLWSEPGLDWEGRTTGAVGTRARGVRGVADDAGWWVRAAPAYRRPRA